jgi:hypothetical protein
MPHLTHGDVTPVIMTMGPKDITNSCSTRSQTQGVSFKLFAALVSALPLPVSYRFMHTLTLHNGMEVSGPVVASPPQSEHYSSRALGILMCHHH